MNIQRALDMMPQKGAMRLLERVIDIDETMIMCRARDHRQPSYPLRIDGRLMGISFVELGAQAAAAHASLHGIGGHHTGLLLALHDVEVNLEDGDAAVGRLICHAEQLFFDNGVARYRLSIHDDNSEQLRGEAMLKMQAVDA